MKEEWNPDRSLPSQSYSFITPELPKDFMDECMEIVEKLDKRQTKTDVVNWKERAEMDAVTKRSGKYLTVDEDETYTDVMPTKEEREARKSSKKPSAINEETRRPAAPKVQVSKQEQNLMDYLGGVMDLLGDK
jgi:hypothetical protein